MPTSRFTTNPRRATGLPGTGVTNSKRDTKGAKRGSIMDENEAPHKKTRTSEEATPSATKLRSSLRTPASIRGLADGMACPTKTTCDEAKEMVDWDTYMHEIDDYILKEFVAKAKEQTRLFDRTSGPLVVFQELNEGEPLGKRRRNLVSKAFNSMKQDWEREREEANFVNCADVCCSLGGKCPPNKHLCVECNHAMHGNCGAPAPGMNNDNVRICTTCLVKRKGATEKSTYQQPNDVMGELEEFEWYGEEGTLPSPSRKKRRKPLRALRSKSFLFLDDDDAKDPPAGAWDDDEPYWCVQTDGTPCINGQILEQFCDVHRNQRSVVLNSIDRGHRRFLRKRLDKKATRKNKNSSSVSNNGIDAKPSDGDASVSLECAEMHLVDEDTGYDSEDDMAIASMVKKNKNPSAGDNDFPPTAGEAVADETANPGADDETEEAGSANRNGDDENNIAVDNDFPPIAGEAVADETANPGAEDETEEAGSANHNGDGENNIAVAPPSPASGPREIGGIPLDQIPTNVTRRQLQHMTRRERRHYEMIQRSIERARQEEASSVRLPIHEIRGPQYQLVKGVGDHITRTCVPDNHSTVQAKIWMPIFDNYGIRLPERWFIQKFRDAYNQTRDEGQAGDFNRHNIQLFLNNIGKLVIEPLVERCAKHLSDSARDALTQSLHDSCDSLQVHVLGGKFEDNPKNVLGLRFGNYLIFTEIVYNDRRAPDYHVFSFIASDRVLMENSRDTPGVLVEDTDLMDVNKARQVFIQYPFKREGPSDIFRVKICRTICIGTPEVVSRLKEDQRVEASLSQLLFREQVRNSLEVANAIEHILLGWGIAVDSMHVRSLRHVAHVQGKKGHLDLKQKVRNYVNSLGYVALVHGWQSHKLLLEKSGTYIVMAEVDYMENNMQVKATRALVLSISSTSRELYHASTDRASRSVEEVCSNLQNGAYGGDKAAKLAAREAFGERLKPTVPVAQFKHYVHYVFELVRG